MEGGRDIKSEELKNRRMENRKSPRTVESEESEIRRIGRDVLSENRMSTLIFYYYSDSVKYRNSLFMKYRHSFTTIIPLNYFVRLATSQLYRPL